MASEQERRRTRAERMLKKAEQAGTIGSFEVDLRTMQVSWSEELYKMHGYRPGEVEPTIELLLDRIHPAERDEIRLRSGKMLESPYPARREYRVQHEDGAVRHVIAENHVEEDDEGNPLRLFGIVQDITDRLETERELRAHYALSQALNEWGDLEEGMVDLLRRLATAMDWCAANLWVRARRGDWIVCRAHWSAPSTDLSEFEGAERAVRVPPGEGVVRRAWDSMEPVSVEDIATDTRVTDPTANLKAGLQSTLLFPAVHQGETLAVLAFHGKEPRGLDDRLVRTLNTLGHDLGRFLSRRRADIGLRKLSDRELQVLQLGAEGLSAPMIGERLTISPTTVKTHFAHVYEKLGVSDRAAAVAEAMRRGLID